MENANDLKEQFKDATKDISFTPKDLEVHLKDPKKGENFSKQAKRYRYYSQAEEICQQKNPEAEVRSFYRLKKQA